MKRNDRILLLKNFLETKDYEACQFTDFGIALENVEDGNAGTSALYHLDNLCHTVFQQLPAISEERSLFRFTSFSKPKDPEKEQWNGDECYTIADIKNNWITLSSPNNFNDPMDPLIKAWVERRKIHPGGKIDKTFYQLVNKTLDKVRICCLVDPLQNKICRNRMKPDIKDCNPLMWAHYADSHKGVCIQYKIKPSNVYENDNLVVRLLDVDYNKPFPLDGKIPFVDSLCVKGDCWKYEKEVRLIMYSREELPPYHQLHDFEIEAVYMGCRIDNNKRNYLINLLRGTDIKLYQMSFSKKDITKLESHIV